MEGLLSFDNILSSEEIDNMFPEEDITPEEENGSVQNSEEDSEEIENNETEEQTTEDTDSRNTEENPESVGSEEANKEQEGTVSSSAGTSPNLYSSIAEGLAVDGIFLNLDNETIGGVNSAETLSEAIDKEVLARMDEQQQRVLRALDNGVPATEVAQYERTINYVNSITEEQLKAETPQGEDLRKNIIYQDLINRGYDEKEAEKRANRSAKEGNDVEDATYALESNKKYFQKAYDDLLKEAENRAAEEKKQNLKRLEDMKSSILKDKNLLGDFELSGDVRNKVVDNISKMKFRNAETGQYMTPLQKYQKENPEDFLKYTGLMFTLTNGFKDFDSFVKGKVKKETKKGLRNLENILNGTRRAADGSLKLVTSTKEDPEAFAGINIAF